VRALGIVVADPSRQPGAQFRAGLEGVFQHQVYLYVRVPRVRCAYRFKELRRRGVLKFRAAVAAGSPTGFWRMSGHPAVQAALRNHHFDSIGLPRLYVPPAA
jgi:hypothetical protein